VGKGKGTIPRADFRIDNFPGSIRKRPDNKMFRNTFADFLRRIAGRPVFKIRILFNILSEILIGIKENNGTDKY
jgi:hypothetical protein